MPGSPTPDMMTASRLAMIDWGIGGISIFKLVKERIGDIPITYLSDTGVTPYGKMRPAELAARLETVIDHLVREGATNIVVGCNAASTALPLIREYNVGIVGMIDTAVDVTVRHQPTTLGLIGGRRTVTSGVYRRAFNKRGIAVRQRIAQPLSAMIESGDTSSETLQTACRQILEPLRKCSHILLACTHYPAILPVLKRCVNESTVFIDPAKEMVDAIAKIGSIAANGDDVYLTSGSTTQMTFAAKAAFDWHIPAARQISL
jgi:glutamate racemase